MLADVAATYAHNLTRAGKTPPPLRARGGERQDSAQRLARVPQVPGAGGQAFLERLDAWLSKHEVKDAEQETAARDSGKAVGRNSSKGTGKRDKSDTVRLGVGVYHVQDDV